jgi:hypothetical protein
MIRQFFDWLRGKMAAADFASAQTDLERYVEELRMMTDEQVGALLGVATVLRVNITEDRVIPPDLFEHSDGLEDKALKRHLWRLNKAVVDFRSKGRGVDAGAMLLWVHSFRALHHPELRATGKLVWAEIARGRTAMEPAWGAIETRTKFPVAEHVKAAHTFVPIGLEHDAQSVSETVCT